MDVQLTAKEKAQLKLIDQGLRTNEKLPHDMATIKLLIEKGLLMSEGMSVRFTPLGKKQLELMR